MHKIIAETLFISAILVAIVGAIGESMETLFVLIAVLAVLVFAFGGKIEGEGRGRHK